jgi:hypothetical protein
MTTCFKLVFVTIEIPRKTIAYSQVVSVEFDSYRYQYYWQVCLCFEGFQRPGYLSVLIQKIANNSLTCVQVWLRE